MTIHIYVFRQKCPICYIMFQFSLPITTDNAHYISKFIASHKT